MSMGCGIEDHGMRNSISQTISSLQTNVARNLEKIKEYSDLGLVNTNIPPNVSQQVQVSAIDGDEVYKYLETYDPEMLDMDKPWKTQPYYFQNVHLTMQAMTKMLTHAVSGGPIEIMGMLVGYYKGNDFYVLDCYPLPVEGTESRVNPQNDSYEFMLRYITKMKESGLRKDQIIGWYHSHPGFGCWLSGIDVQTQKLHQGFEDPYLAIVVDPLKSIREGKIDIGAFRTFYDSHQLNGDDCDESEEVHKQDDLGWHSKDYYPLDVKLMLSKLDHLILEKIDNDQPKYTNLVVPEDESIIESIDINKTRLPDTEYNAIQIWKKFNKLFESISLESLRSKKLSIDIDSIDQISLYSSGNDIKMNNYDQSNTPSLKNIDHGNSEADDNYKKYELAKIGTEMDMITLQELKKLMIKQAQYKFFE